ncbi:MAG TPA: ferredoxin [Lachnospiraceae bacterium]|nr:ferredoxin [Lachnospiraceae bacterium]
MKAKVDQEMCIGCGLCTGTAPEVFRMNEDDKAEAYAEFGEDGEEAVKEAIDGCPVSAISRD